MGFFSTRCASSWTITRSTPRRRVGDPPVQAEVPPGIAVTPRQALGPHDDPRTSGVNIGSQARAPPHRGNHELASRATPREAAGVISASLISHLARVPSPERPAMFVMNNMPYFQLLTHASSWPFTFFRAWPIVERSGAG